VTVYGTTIYIEDLELRIPHRERQQSNYRTVSSINRQSKATRTSKPVTYDLVHLNDETLAQLEELTANPFFFATPIRGLEDHITNGAITNLRRTWQVGASPVRLSLLKGSNKWMLVVETILSSLHDRWNIIIEEDFDGNGAFPDNGACGTTTASTGYNRQVQTITWTEEEGSWNTDDSFYVVNSANDQSLRAASVSTDMVMSAGCEWMSDYIIECWIYQDDAGSGVIDGDQDPGLVFRFVDTSNYYRFYGTDDSTLVFSKDATAIKTYTLSTAMVADVWYHFKVEAFGNRFKCYFNGTLIFDEIHTDLVAGKVGVYAHDNEAYFDDFRCTLGRPTTFNLPPDTEWTNQYVHDTVNTAHGTQKKLIAPTQDVQFTLGASDDDCLVYLKMNEGSGDIVYDHSKNKNHLQIVGAIWVEDTEKGWCLDFDGTDDYATIPVAIGDGVSIDQGTINLDVYIDAVSGSQNILEIGNGYLGDSADLRLYIDGTYLKFLI
jgi:hypothetical protein